LLSLTELQVLIFNSHHYQYIY